MLIAAVLALAACTSPVERCIANATRGLSEIDAQIAEAEANIARGYRLADGVATVGLDFCSSGDNVKFCVGGTRDLPQRRIPIDVEAEKARLAALLAQRERMAARAELEIAACQELA
jgi:hypothetical protein